MKERERMFGSSPPPPFGQSSNSPFGSSTFQQSQPAFGMSNTPAFGASNSAPSFSFGSSPAFGQSTSAFGTSTFPFGTAAFGPLATTPSFGSSGFGQTGFGGQQQHNGSRVAAYSPTSEVDNGKLESVSAMPVYKDKSHEELRWEDYQLGDKGGQSPAAAQSAGGATGLGGATNSQSNPSATSSTFGQWSANPFSSTTPSNNPFASKPSAFGSSTTATFGSSPFSTSSTSNPFGSAAQAPGTSSVFVSASSFGNTQSSPLFQSTTPSSPGQANPIFGQTGSSCAQTTPSFFGQSNIFSTPSTGDMFYTPALRSTGNSVGFGQMTVVDKPAPVRISPLLSSRHLSQRRIRLPARKYHPNNDGSKGPFFTDDEELSSTPKANALFVPRDNPRALLICPLEQWPRRTSPERLSPLQDMTPNYENEETVENGKQVNSVISNQKPNDVENHSSSQEWRESASWEDSVSVCCRIPNFSYFNLGGQSPAAAQSAGGATGFGGATNTVSNPSATSSTFGQSSANLFSSTTPSNSPFSSKPSAFGSSTTASSFGNTSDMESGQRWWESTCFRAAEAELLVLEYGAEIAALMPKLRHAYYYTDPRIEEIAAKEKAEPGYCCHVKDFVVGRQDYGSIKFIGETDVRGLDIESIVQFNNREVIVYIDGTKKPPVGQGLNKPAEVSLYNIRCFDKKTGHYCTEGPNIDKFMKKLKKKAEDQGVKFVSYDPIEAELKFRANHFSTYSI